MDKRTQQPDDNPGKKERLMAQLALLMESVPATEHTVDDRTLAAYCEGRLGAWQMAQVREVLASDEQAFELFMALADQFAEMRAGETAFSGTGEAKPGFWQRLKSHWIMTTGGAGGLVAACFALVMVVSPSLNDQVTRSFDHVPSGATTWDYVNYRSKGAIVSLERQALSHGIYLAILRQGNSQQWQSLAAKYEAEPPSCDTSENCEQRLMLAQTLGQWLAVNQLLCSQPNAVKSKAWESQLAVRNNLNEEVQSTLRDTELKMAFAAFVLQIDNAMAAEVVNLAKICDGNLSLMQ